MNSEPILDVKDLHVYYDDFHALKGISITIPEKTVTAFIGPSGCGKSTLLRCFNRMNDLIEGVRVTGRVEFHGKNIYDPDVNVTELRSQIGMVFQKSNPFPMSIYDNIVYGLKKKGVRDRQRLNETVEKCLRGAALWDEVKDKLKQNALALSGGQQQRLCIARALAMEPEILLMDEPCSALDPVATAKIEDLMAELKENYTIVIVTHNMQQAARVSEYTAFLYLGELVEYNKTDILFTHPEKKKTEDYITGRFG